MFNHNLNILLRRKQLINEHPIDEESQDDSNADSGDVPQTQLPETLEEEDVYHEIVGDNRLRQQYKIPSLATENSNDKVFNNFVLVGFDQDDYDELKKAEAIFIALDLPKHIGFYWACINTHKELVFWGGLSSGSPSSVGNNLGGRNSPGCWGPVYPQWGTPPNAPQWRTPPNAPQWGTPPNAL
ncbi:predicted protein [Arabidopsis lyrata subsp. lyrata]|uniref:Predicted protein n=1 Tax=Arabidopsis lyrata subsp. lyrata TaxID=81972 RepID=D7L061_ARALL|nr:predicted protein [Arabidopsis lyrata subsp. lyrata]